MQFEGELFQSEIVAREDVTDASYPRKRADAIVVLLTRAEREASLLQVPTEFRALVRHFVFLALSDELAKVDTREQADRLIALIPAELVDMVKAKARAAIQARRVRFRDGLD